MSEAKPKLRAEIEALPTRHHDEEVFVLYDRTGLSPAQLGVSPAVMYLASLLDGRFSILELRDIYARETGGATMTGEDLLAILNALDEALFLDNERYRTVLEQEQRDFACAPCREPASAGSAYTDDPAKLRAELDAILAGAPPDEEPPAAPAGPEAPRALIVPHLDYPRGAAGYGQAYRLLAKRRPPAAVVVLGIAHDPLQNRLSVCDKDFAVPGGMVKNARWLTKRLIQAGRPDADFSAEAFAHRREHSVELQTVWLRHIWGEAVRIGPVLCASLYEYFLPESEGRSPLADPQQTAFITALREMLAGADRVMLLASADLAHVGPGFDEETPLDEKLLAETEEADRHYLSAVAAGQAEAGLDSLRRHGNRYNVCGGAAIYALNAALPDTPGRLLGYHQSSTPELQKAVTYAAMVFE